MTAAAPPTSGRAAARVSGVDRYLCASAWLEPAFARYVHGELIRPGLRATAPAYGIDYVGLARHTRAARRHRATVLLLAVADLIAVVAGAPAAARWGGGGEWTDGAAAALSVVVTGAVLLVVLVGWHLHTTRARASRILFDSAPPREAVPHLDPRLEADLSARADPNVVPFGGGMPFVGAGHGLERWKARVDTTRPGTDGGGRKRRITPVSAEELQKALSVAVRGAGFPDIEVNNRLFVAGHHVGLIPGLLPDREQRPRPTVERRHIRAAIDGSTETARTYLCVEKDSWVGELVVTLYIRAVQFGSELFLEFYAYVLLPLHPVVRAADRLPVTTVGRLLSVLRTVVPTTLRLVRHAPRTALTMLGWRWSIARRIPRQRRQVRKMPSFDYGAVGGIRSVVAAKQREWLFAYEDEDMYVQALRTQVMKVLVRYVDDHGIDTSDLERQQTKIVNTTYKIGDVKGRNVVIGDNTTFNDLATGWASDQDDPPEDDEDTDPGPSS